ncbi:MAG: aspartyl/asparaginyl beta-hydroxylase domain-containing protein [Chitinophagales bacterium]
MIKSKNNLFYPLMVFFGKQAFRIFGGLVSIVDTHQPFMSSYKNYPFHLLEENWTIILEEYLSALNIIQPKDIQSYFEEQKKIVLDNEWQTIPLRLYNHNFNENCALFPKTIEILNQIGGVSSVLFSALLAGKEIRPHKGPYKGVVRCHLGLIIPSDRKNCKIVVNNKIRHWNEGKVLLLDDTFEHYAVNHTKEDRVVLFLDIDRKLPFPLNIVNKFFFNILAKTAYTKDVLKAYI